eukprot:g2280.t1
MDQAAVHAWRAQQQTLEVQLDQARTKLWEKQDIVRTKKEALETTRASIDGERDKMAMLYQRLLDTSSELSGVQIELAVLEKRRSQLGTAVREARASFNRTMEECEKVVDESVLQKHAGYNALVEELRAVCESRDAVTALADDAEERRQSTMQGHYSAEMALRSAQSKLQSIETIINVASVTEEVQVLRKRKNVLTRKVRIRYGNYNSNYDGNEKRRDEYGEGGVHADEEDEEQKQKQKQVGTSQREQIRAARIASKRFSPKGKGSFRASERIQRLAVPRRKREKFGSPVSSSENSPETHARALLNRLFEEQRPTNSKREAYGKRIKMAMRKRMDAIMTLKDSVRKGTYTTDFDDIARIIREATLELIESVERRQRNVLVDDETPVYQRILAAIPGSLDFLGRNEEMCFAVRDVCFKRNPFLLAEDEYLNESCSIAKTWDERKRWFSAERAVLDAERETSHDSHHGELRVEKKTKKEEEEEEEEETVNNESLHAACKRGQQDVVDALLSRLGDDAVGAEDKNGMTPLHVSCDEGHPTIVEKLLMKGASVHVIANDGSTPLHCCCFGAAPSDERNKCAEYLIFHGAHLDATDNQGKTPCHLAAARGSCGIIRLLGDNDADIIGATDKEGNTPLHTACIGRQREATKVLLEYAAEPSRRNLAGKTPTDIAEENGDSEIVDMLLYYGATPRQAKNDQAAEVSPLPLEKVHDSEWGLYQDEESQCWYWFNFRTGESRWSEEQ